MAARPWGRAALFARWKRVVLIREETGMENALNSLYEFVVTYGLKIVGAILILIVGRIIAGVVRKGVRKGLGKSNVEVALVTFFGHLVYIAIMAFAVLAALAKFGVQTASFVAVLGAAGFAVGFALQGSLSNFAAGVMLLVFRPFKVGDYVDAGGTAGTVKEIQLFTTVLATPDNVKVIAPNGAVFGSTIKNYTGYDTRRVDLSIGISYDSSMRKAKEIMEDLIKNDERTLDDPPMQIAVAELADSSVNFVVRMWVKKEDYWAVKFDMTQAIKDAFDQAGIEIPFPQRVIHQARAA
jgi:small conductance mechanosensitive channel